MSMICNRCEMLTEPMGHNCEFCGKCVGGDECKKHKDTPSTPLPEQGEAMTNYNEKLDEVERHFRAAWKQTQHKTVQVPAYGLAWHEARQALTSLTKELVLEARIDEMDVALAEVTHWSIDDSDSAIHGYGKHRIAELKQELESYDQL